MADISTLGIRLVMDFLTEHEWRELLQRIHSRGVLPIIGPDLVTVSLGGADTGLPLQNFLAADLAAALGVKVDAMTGLSINNVVCRHLLAGGDPHGIYWAVAAILDRLEAPPPRALVDLASITDFDVYISGTVDHLLAKALEKERPGFHRDSDVAVFTYNAPVDLPASRGEAFLYHLLGSRQTCPDFAVWEEDHLAFLHGLVEHADGLKQLFRLLKQRYLLLLGMPFNDWLLRFFLFVANGERFSRTRGRNSCLTDQVEKLGEPLVFFFDQVVGTTRIVGGDPAAFVGELTERWRGEFGGTAEDSDVLKQVSDEIPRDAVFVSYSSDDLEAIARLVKGLRAAQIPVWLDKHRLHAGENYEDKLKLAVKEHCSFFISVISKATERGLADEHGELRFVHRERCWAAERHFDGYVFYLPVVIDDTSDPTLEPAVFARMHHDRLKGGTLTPTFAKRVRALVDEYRRSGRPRA